MPKKSKWLDVEFAPADFRNPYNAIILTKVLPLIEDATYKSMLDGEPQLLLEAIKKFPFPQGCPYWPLTCFNLTYDFKQAPALTHIAEHLWYLYAPSKAKIKAHAKEKNLSLKDAKEQLCKHQAQSLRGSFTHAWRLYDGYIHDKVCEAVYGFINEVVTQAIWELPLSPSLPLTRLQLYKIATKEEEARRKQRMKFSAGGRKSDYNLRWFPHNYARAYRDLQDAAKTYEESQSSKDKKVRGEWQKKIKESFPELDDELIARLSGKERDLTEEHLALLAEKGGDSTPSEIALEQAVRWCGIKRYTYTKRALLKRLEKKKPLRQKPVLKTFLVNWYAHGEKLEGELLKELCSILGV